MLERLYERDVAYFDFLVRFSFFSFMLSSNIVAFQVIRPQNNL